MYATESKNAGYAAAPPPGPVNPSAFGSIEDACRQVRETAQRVSHYVNRLCGQEPETPANAPRVVGVPNGLLAEAEDHAAAIRDAVANINSGLDRLEKRLP